MGCQLSTYLTWVDALARFAAFLIRGDAVATFDKFEAVQRLALVSTCFLTLFLGLKIIEVPATTSVPEHFTFALVFIVEPATNSGSALADLRRQGAELWWPCVEV